MKKQPTISVLNNGRTVAFAAIFSLISLTQWTEAQTQVVNATGNITDATLNNPWDNGLPSPTNIGIINIAGTWGVAPPPAISNWVVNQSTGTVNRTTAGNVLLRDLTVWNLSGGTIQASNGAVSVGANVAGGGANLNVSGGSVSASGNFNVTHSSSLFTMSAGSITAGAAFALAEGSISNISGGTVNAAAMTLANANTQITLTGGTVSVAGTLTLTVSTSTNSIIEFGLGSGALDVGGLSLAGNGYFNFVTGTNGSFTVAGYNATDFETLWASSRLRVDNGNVGNFNDLFEVNGSTLTLIPEPSTIGVTFAILLLTIGLSIARKKHSLKMATT